MHPFRELPRRRPRARLLGMHVPLRRGRRGPACLQEYSPRQLAAVIGVALAAGAALEFFLDPRSGKRRRHLARDRTRAALRRRARTVERQAHYEAGKMVGAAHAITRHQHAIPELDDVSLVRKVESELFRDRTIPKGPISINADRGIVVLRGQLEDAQQIQRIEREVRGVAGVREVENLLHPPGVPGAGKPSTPRPARDARARVGPGSARTTNSTSSGAPRPASTYHLLSQRSEAPLQPLWHPGLLCPASGTSETTSRIPRDGHRN